MRRHFGSVKINIDDLVAPMAMNSISILPPRNSNFFAFAVVLHSWLKIKFWTESLKDPVPGVAPH